MEDLGAGVEQLFLSRFATRLGPRFDLNRFCLT